jgi:1,4-dihydroxy-2-naphthoyl-CoA synthase
LEFFIPQICSFFLRGDSEHSEELLNFILTASSVNFFFAHRVWFFCQSAMYQDMEHETLVNSRKMLRGLKDECLQSSKEILYLANSADVLKVIQSQHL